MSLTRFAAPGRPTILVDQGPATGRVSFTRYGIRGGSLEGALVVGHVKSNAQHQAAYKEREAVKARARRLYAGEDLTTEEREWRRREYFREWQRERRAQGLRSNGHRPKEYNGAGGVSTEPNRLPAATVAFLLTPGDGRRAASGSKTDA